MIRIEKPAGAPPILIDLGKKARRANSGAYTKNSTAYQTGAKEFTFRERIYAAPEVKAALVQAQHGKCCFCERLIEGEADVEHFRPKRGWQQELGVPMHKPGYYWLAYEWENLYLCCGACNSRFKRNLFPLRDAAQRAYSHKHDLTLEDPLFVDPGKDDPAEHISFRGEIPYALPGSIKGEPTIAALRLRERAGAKESRFQRLKILKRLAQVVRLADSQPENAELQAEAALARATLSAAVEPSAEYAAATRAAIAAQFKYVPD